MDAQKYIITKILLQLGFTPAYHGFFYLREAVRIAAQDPESLTLITKLIYAPLAKTYGTSAENIEKSIRKAAEAVWKINGGTGKTVTVLNQTYCYPASRPENKELITSICDFLKKAGKILNTDIRDGI